MVSTLIPMSRAASGSWAVARMALPSRLFATKAVRRITSGIVAAIASRSPREMEMPNTLNSSFWESDQVRHAPLRGAEPEDPHVLEDEGEADRGDQGREFGRAPNGR